MAMLKALKNKNIRHGHPVKPPAPNSPERAVSARQLLIRFLGKTGKSIRLASLPDEIAALRALKDKLERRKLSEKYVNRVINRMRQLLSQGRHE